jgi:cellulose synthase/poly-beta-1,6-N-acetylglucosamine synthase-like glycosyltransferase
VPASELAGLRRGEATPLAGGGERRSGRLLLGALDVARIGTGALELLLIPLALLVLLRALAAACLAGRTERPRKGTAFMPPVSIVVPAHNEHACIARTVRALVASAYPVLEVIVVDDGSTDGTRWIVQRLRLPNVRVVSQPNLGKAAALNTGLAAAEHDVIVAVDADTLLEEDALPRLVEPLRDPRVGAVAGNPKVGNRTGRLGRWQHLEYVTGPGLDRRICSALGMAITVPGAAGAFRREAIEGVGGFSGATLAEDTDATLELARAGWKVAYAEHARAFTEAPDSLDGLWRQRYRWSYGMLQSAWKHRAAVRRRGERRVGWRAIPYLLLFQIALPLLAPLADLLALYGLVFVDPGQALLYWIVFNAFLLLQAEFALRLDGEPTAPLWELPLQQLAYRQLMYLVVLQSLASAVIGARLRWYRVERTGDAELATSR